MVHSKVREQDSLESDSCGSNWLIVEVKIKLIIPGKAEARVHNKQQVAVTINL
jgi:hypothetical protein